MGYLTLGGKSQGSKLAISHVIFTFSNTAVLQNATITWKSLTQKQVPDLKEVGEYSKEEGWSGMETDGSEDILGISASRGTKDQLAWTEIQSNPIRF